MNSFTFLSVQTYDNFQIKKLKYITADHHLIFLYRRRMLTHFRFLLLIVVVQFYSVSYADILFTCYDRSHPAFEFLLASNSNVTSYLRLFKGAHAGRKFNVRKLHPAEKYLEFGYNITEFVTSSTTNSLSYSVGIFNVDMNNRIMPQESQTSVYMQRKGRMLTQYTECKKVR